MTELGLKAVVLAARVVYWLSALPVLGPVFETAARLMGRRRVSQIDFADAGQARYPLCDGGPSQAVSPEFVGSAPTSYASAFPGIEAHLIREGIVTADSAHVATDDALLASAYRIAHEGRIPANPKSLGYAGGGVIYVAQSHHRQIDRGILIGGDGGSNWYHFLIECLPKAYLAERLPARFADFPLLVPQQCETIPNFRRALQLFSQGREVIALDPKKRLRVSELLAIDEVVHAPFNLRRGLWPVVQDYAQHDDLLREYLAVLRERIGLSPSGPDAKKRIYLARPAGRRSHNQDDLVGIAARYGFEPVSPESLSLRAQAQLYADADYVIGASGAAWANLGFSPTPLRGLSWLIPQYKAFSTYASLARLLGSELLFLEAKPTRPVTSTHAAYSASYRIDPTAFEAAVRQLVQQG